jgi:hypothetical protein
VYLNGERLSADRRPVVSGELLHGRFLLVRKGARSYGLVRVSR